MQLFPQGGLHLGGSLRQPQPHAATGAPSRKVPALRFHASPAPSRAPTHSSSSSSSSPLGQGIATHYTTTWLGPTAVPSPNAAAAPLPIQHQAWEWSEKHEPSKEQPTNLYFPSSNGDQPSRNGSSSTTSIPTASISGDRASSSSRPPGMGEQRQDEVRQSNGTASTSTRGSSSENSSSSSSSSGHPDSMPSTSYTATALDAPRPVSPSSRTSFVYYGDDYEPILSSGIPLTSAKRMQAQLSPATAAAAASLDATAQANFNGSSPSSSSGSSSEPDGAAASVTAAATAAAAAATAAATPAPASASTSTAAPPPTLPGLPFDPAVTTTATSSPSPAVADTSFPLQAPLPPTPGTLPPFPVLPQGITAESILHPPPSTDPLTLPSLKPPTPPTDALPSQPELPAAAAATATAQPSSAHSTPLQPAPAAHPSTAAAASSGAAVHAFADPRPQYRWPSGVERDGPPSWLEQAQQRSKDQAASGQGGPTPELLENFAKLWALLVLSATYVHQASTGYSIPIMMPMISTSLSLTDFQGALLTSGYSYLYALALIPAGVLADKGNRPRLLGLSALAWSGFSALSSQASTFGDLMISRIGLATAQSSQNVICFSMIPDLFPKNKSFALAVYNSAIYVGRGLMFVLLTGVRSVMFPTQPVGQDGSTAMSVISHQVMKDASGNLLVPLEKIDLRLVQIMYTTGDMAAIRSISPFDFTETTTVVDQPWINEQMWRTVLEWVAFPGFVLGAAMLLTVPETRKPFLAPPQNSDTSNKSTEASTTTYNNNNTGSSSSSNNSVSSSGSSGSSAVLVSASGSAAAAASLPALDSQSAAAAATTEAAAAAAAEAAAAAAARVEDRAKDVIPSEPAGWAGVALLLQNSAFMSTTLAAALNDVASYALVAWQSTFYERVYGLSTDQYAPVLATILPIAGIMGGVGGGALADKLAQSGKRGVVTVGASLLAAPFIWASFMADNPTESFAALGVGFALSESWRAPAAVMARSVAPPSMSSTASAIYLSVRNIIGGLGPLAVAQLATIKDLRSALELLPLMYLLSGATFSVAEKKLNAVKAQQLAVSEAQAAAAEVQYAAEQVIEQSSGEGGSSSSSSTSKESGGSAGGGK